MQFREKSFRIQVLAYESYNSHRRRGVVKMVGSFNKHTYALSDGLLGRLTDEQKQELTAHIKKMRQLSEAAYRLSMLASVVRNLADADALLSVGMSFEVCDLDARRAEAVWRSMKVLGTALKAAGFPLPKKRARKPKKNAAVSNPGPPLTASEPTAKALTDTRHPLQQHSLFVG